MQHLILSVSICCFALSCFADPCGMVPPIYTGEGQPITRIGEQQTYVFYRNGIETCVIRPGFQGKVGQFGMLIPFPSPPAIRKLPDNIFPHIAAAIDPPEVVVNLLPVPLAATEFDFATDNSLKIRRAVRVLREEAVGMYDVAVLEAGSAAALRKWMDRHGFQYPDGMDAVCDDYVQLGWCFVAVKTRVGDKASADPHPGRRTAKTGLAPGATFDGHVQAMGFRFKSEQLVVPMRLSAFNDGELRNIVYLLTDGPRKIRAIPEEFVVRQVRGSQLIKNVTEPLPLRIIGGTINDLDEHHRRNLRKRRDPTTRNGAARDLFAADLLSVSKGSLALNHEETEKELLRIGEHLGLRGSKIDELNGAALSEQRNATVNQALGALKDMTLTVVDGDFPRDVLANQNLTFAAYSMPANKNRPEKYDATRKAPSQPSRSGKVYYGDVSDVAPPKRPWHQMLVASLVVAGIVVAGKIRKMKPTE